MFMPHLPAVGIDAPALPHGWPVAVTVAVAFGLIAFLAYHDALTWQRLRLAAAELKAERRLHSATVESLFNPYVLAEPVWDAAGHVVDFTYADVNPAACEWIGVGRDQLLGRRVIDVFPSLATVGLDRAFAATAETGLPTALEAVLISHPTEGMRWVDIRAVRVEGRVSFVWRDVTEPHIKEEKLAASEEQFRLLAENSSDVIVRLDRDGRVLWASPSVTAVLGWSSAECIGRAVDEFFASREGREQFRRELQAALAGQPVVLRTQLLAKAGDTRWVEIHAGPYRAAQGQVDSIVASFRRVDVEVAAQHALEHRASTDELTKLLKRNEAFEWIETLNKRAGRVSAVLLCDIDRFKFVNDTYGHATGDVVLQTLAERIRGCLRSTDDMAARIGGDEFLVVLHGVHDLSDAVNVAEKLCSGAASPIATAAGPITATLSIGVTLAHADESTDAIVARADDAMYQAKSRGRNRVVGLEVACADSTP
jgi:diguanylate cyclase (GGDEF)-like protein/PAS domain S-box-containing protein